MTIIRKGVTKLGSYSVIKENEKTVAADGAEDCIFFMAIPPYAHMGYANIHVDSIMSGSDGVDPWRRQEVAISGRLVDFDRMSSTNPLVGDDWDDYMEDFASIAADEITAFGDSENVGITGGMVTSEKGDDIEFLRREYTCKLGKNAYPTNANKIRYQVACNYKGHLRTPRMVNISVPKLLVMGVTVNVAQVTGEEHDAAGGGYTSWDALYEALVDNIPAHSGTQIQMGDTLPNSGSTNLEAYLHKGVQRDDISGAGVSMNTVVRFSGRLDVYSPDRDKYVPAP